MSVVGLWVRADLRRRWRSWVVLGLLAGVSAGLAFAGIAGARRTDRAAPAYIRAAHFPDAAVLPNDPGYTAALRAKVAALPEVKTEWPFVVPFVLEVGRPSHLEHGLVPVNPSSMPMMAGPIVAGRLPNPKRADEIVVNENVRDRFGLNIGATMTLVQDPRAFADLPSELLPQGKGKIDQQLTVVGISKSTDNELDSMPSSGFYTKYRADLVGVVNQFIVLKHGRADLVKFQTGVERVLGHPVNVESVDALFHISQVTDTANVERNGLLLFAFVVIIGAGALVGQALVRAVTAGAAELPTWRAIGADRGIVVRALVAPVAVSAAVGAVTSVLVAIALSPRFPLGSTRPIDLDIGFHADWLVLGFGVVALVVAMLVAAWVSAEISTRRRERARPRVSATAQLATAAGLSPALLIGSRLAVEPGRGRRAVPVRSALVGAIVGVLGVVGCLTFRAGLSDTISDPARSGIVWDFTVASESPVSAKTQAYITHSHGVTAALDALWARAVRINGRPVPAFGTKPVKGNVDLVVIDGHAPHGPKELALAPSTMDDLGVHVGDHVRVGGSDRRMQVVGRALLPETSHTSYDQSAWMTLRTLKTVLPSDGAFGEDRILVRLRPGTEGAAVAKHLAATGNGEGEGAERPVLPSAVVNLGKLRTLPFALAIFFALLAIATVAHALVTTVRRRRHDLAVLRSIGFTKRDARVAIAWQSTLIAIVGLVVGVPLGIVTGRLLWKQLAENLPVAYVPPLALVAILLVVPLAIMIANLVAAGPAHAATRIRPARVLRTE